MLPWQGIAAPNTGNKKWTADAVIAGLRAFYRQTCEGLHDAAPPSLELVNPPAARQRCPTRVRHIQSSYAGRRTSIPASAAQPFFGPRPRSLKLLQRLQIAEGRDLSPLP